MAGSWPGKRCSTWANPHFLVFGRNLRKPNEPLHGTGHATDGPARHGAAPVGASRVGQHAKWVFGERRRWCYMETAAPPRNYPEWCTGPLDQFEDAAYLLRGGRAVT